MDDYTKLAVITACELLESIDDKNAFMAAICTAVDVWAKKHGMSVEESIAMFDLMHETRKESLRLQEWEDELKW